MNREISRCHPRFLCVYSRIRWWYHFSSFIPHIILSISSECPNMCAQISCLCLNMLFQLLSHARTNHTKYVQNTIQTFVMKQVQWIPMHTNKQRIERKSKNQKERLYIHSVRCPIFKLQLSAFQHAINKSKIFSLLQKKKKMHEPIGRIECLWIKHAIPNDISILPTIPKSNELWRSCEMGYWLLPLYHVYCEWQSTFIILFSFNVNNF